MRLNERQRQLGDLADELFEPAVFLSPLFDFWEEIHRHVNGMGLGFNLPRQVVAQVLLASGASAIGIAASAAEGDEAGRQDRALGLALLLAGLEAAADQGGMFGYFHTFTGAIFRPGYMNSIKAYQLQEQNRGLRQLF